MKKIKIFFLLTLFVAGFIGCKDYMDYSTLHNLTDEEKAELARQDSIKEAQKNNINANLILNYRAEFTVSKSLYDGVSVPISIDSIANLFKLTKEQVLAGIAGEAGAPEIKPFAIDWTTRADVGSATSTNGPWGHWWDVNGDATTYNDANRLANTFCEFDATTGEFNVGQFPNRVIAGDTIKVIEALKYNELRVAVVITILPIAAGQINAKVVDTQELTLEVTPKASYDPDSLQFDLNKVLSSLGISSMDAVKFLGVNKDGSYSQEAVTGKGFWYDLEGFVGEWGDNASVYTNYGDFAANRISVGQYPDRLAADQNYTIQYGFMANNKIVLLKINVKVVGYQDPETPPAGSPEALVVDVLLGKKYSNDYASVTFDAKDIMRNAFKMTTYQIHQAIAKGDLKLYQGAVSETAPAYTADAPGYWLKADGTVGQWAESVVWTSIGHNETELFLFGGNHPDNTTPGTTVKTKYIATCNGGSVTFNITFNVTADDYVDPETPPTGAPEALTMDIDLQKTYSDDYATVTADVKEKMRSAFKMTTYQIHKAIESGALKLYQGTVSETAPAYTADVPGYWLKADGTVGSWGQGAVVWVSIGHTETELFLYGGNHPTDGKAGDKVTTTYIATCNGGSVTFKINFTVK